MLYFLLFVSNRLEEKAFILAVGLVLFLCIFSCDLVHFLRGRETNFREVAYFPASYARGISSGTFLTPVVFRGATGKHPFVFLRTTRPSISFPFRFIHLFNFWWRWWIRRTASKNFLRLLTDWFCLALLMAVCSVRLKSIWSFSLGFTSCSPSTIRSRINSSLSMVGEMMQN